MIPEEQGEGGERMKLSELACAGGLRAILNLDSRINEGKQSPEEMWLEALTYPPFPTPKRDKVQRKFPQRGFLRNQHASPSGARSLGSKVYTELQGRGRIFWKVSQLRWGRSPTLGDNGGWDRASLGTQWSFSWVTGEDIEPGKPLEEMDTGGRGAGKRWTQGAEGQEAHSWYGRHEKYS